MYKRQVCDASLGYIDAEVVLGVAEGEVESRSLVLAAFNLSVGTAYGVESKSSSRNLSAFR